MSEEKIKQDVVDEEISEPTEATKEQSEAQNAEESVVDASEVLEELKADFDNRYKRLQADFENFKRRTNQEKEQLAGFVKGDVLKDLLPVLDNFETSCTSSSRRGYKGIPRWIYYDSSKFDGYVV